MARIFYNPPMKRIFLLTFLVLSLGCANEKQGLLLTQRTELKANLTQLVRIDGVARFQSITGPAIETPQFVVRVYPTNAWGADVAGKQVSVIGKLLESSVSTPPDPSVNPGEYWLSEATWKLIPAEKP